MCMNNININIMPADILKENNSNLSIYNIDKKFRIVYADNMRYISLLSFILAISASQSKDMKPSLQINTKETFVFDDEYIVKLRLTETYSGNFLDIGEFILSSKDSEVNNKGICRPTLTKNLLYTQSNIPLPTASHHTEKYVIKALIKNKNCNESEPWLVQTICPIELIEFEEKKEN